MSYHFRGRSTHDAAEYRRWRAEAEAQDVIAAANASRAEASSLRQRLQDLNRQYDNDVRGLARRQARTEQQQQQQRHLLDQVSQRQEEFERLTERRQEELASELHEAIDESETRLQEEINEARAEATRQVAAVRQEVQVVRQEMQDGFETVDMRITTVRDELQKKTTALKAEIDQERKARLAKEADRIAEATALIDWLDDRLGDLRDSDSLDLNIEVVRIQEGVRNARQKLADKDKERALPIVDNAFSDYQTAYVESERRKGVIDGVTDHVLESTARLRELIGEGAFATVFAEEGERLLAAAELLDKRADSWHASYNWHIFKNERNQTVAAANALVAAAVELQSAVPNLTRRIQERDAKIEDIANAVTDLMGAADGFEATFANPKDPKSPRLLRTRIGHATVDAYLHLDGGFDVEAYGFQSAGDCQRMQERMQRKLQHVWHVDAAETSHDNPQSATISLPHSAERWQAVSSEIGSIASVLS